METRSKKMKTSSEDEDVFVKYQVPDEILEKIISYVPSKNNCFLVSKRFQRESIRATRDKCSVNLTRDNAESPGFENIQWEFDEIRLIGWSEYRPKGSGHDANKTFVLQSLKFIEKFGKRIKKLLVYNLWINPSDFLKLLIPMPNLVELHFKSCFVHDTYQQVLQSSPSPVEVLQMTKLEKLLYDGQNSVIDIIGRLSCPSLLVLAYKNEWPNGSKISEIHTLKLKDVELKLAGGVVQHREIFEQLHQCKLERFSVCTFFGLALRSTGNHIAQLIKNQPQLKSLQLYGDVTKEEQLRVVNLEHLESLDIEIRADAPLTQLLVDKIMQMRQLKSLKIALFCEQSIESLLSIRNEQLQSLELECGPNNDVVVMSRIGDNFPNLKHLGLLGVGKVCLKFISRLKKLVSLKLIKISSKDTDDYLEVNESVRYFSFFLTQHSTESAILKLVQAMPNLQKVEYSFNWQKPTKQLLDKILSLQHLVEIKCVDYSLKNELITCIKNRPHSSKLQRIICQKLSDNDDDEVFEIYKKQFPFKRVNYVTDEIILSCF